jgi:hypothetical protein
MNIGRHTSRARVAGRVVSSLSNAQSDPPPPRGGRFSFSRWRRFEWRSSRTFSIIKPDATARNLTGAINAMIEQSGLCIVAQKRISRAGRNLLFIASARPWRRLSLPISEFIYPLVKPGAARQARSPISF